jgi:hypothetical protein
MFRAAWRSKARRSSGERERATLVSNPILEHAVIARGMGMGQGIHSYRSAFIKTLGDS